MSSFESSNPTPSTIIMALMLSSLIISLKYPEKPTKVPLYTPDDLLSSAASADGESSI